MCAKVASVVSKSATLWTEPARLVCPCRVSRREHLSGLPCPPPGDLLDPGIEPVSHYVSCTGKGTVYCWLHHVNPCWFRMKWQFLIFLKNDNGMSGYAGEIACNLLLTKKHCPPEGAVTLFSLHGEWEACTRWTFLIELEIYKIKILTNSYFYVK